MRLGTLGMLLALASPAGAAGVRGARPPPRTAELLEAGRVAYGINCASCHGEHGHGDGVSAAALDPRPRNFATEPFRHGARLADVFRTISRGIPGTGMAGFADLPEEERWALAYHVLDLRGRAPKK